MTYNQQYQSLIINNMVNNDLLSFEDYTTEEYDYSIDLYEKQTNLYRLINRINSTSSYIG